MTNRRVLNRMASIMAAVLLLVASSPLLMPGRASAATFQLSTRSIQMSDSANSGTSITSGVGSGTAVTYRVTFNVLPGSSTTKSLIIDFCSEDPIISDVCTAPTGMATTGATVSPVSGAVGASGWTIATPSPGQVKLASDGTTNSITAGSTQSFDIVSITNPSTVGTFYARMYTYPTNTFGTYTGPTGVNADNHVDYGGIALSTTRVITITARVQETLTFCVTTADPSLWTTTHDCSDTAVSSNPPAVTLGHFSGPTRVLDANTVDNNTPVYTQLSTNATSGAVINIRNSNLTCGGLSADGGTTCAIPAQNGGSGAGPTAIAIGSTGGAQFGLFVSNSSADVNGVGTLTADSTYHSDSHCGATSVVFPVCPNTGGAGDYFYSMDTTAGIGVTSTFGSTLAASSAPVYRLDTQYIFAATAALTTPAGIYTANMSMIATGTF
jgi:hypothetical protein